MSDTAYQTQYRDEYIAAFERRDSLLRACVTTEVSIKGNTVVFLVAGSGGASAVTRGVNGRIPARSDDNTQLSCTISEWHDLVEKTNFNIFASQGDQKRIMQETTQAVINRKADDQIITELQTATLTTGPAVPFSLAKALHAKTILGNNNAGGSMVYAAITPAAYAYLAQNPEFTNIQYVDIKPFAATNDAIEARFRWMNIEWIVHTGLPGLGTAAEVMFMWNMRAMGHAADVKGLQTPVGYNDEQDYSWARASMNMGAKKLQNSGIVLINHDGSAFGAV